MKRKLRKAASNSESLFLTIPKNILELLNLQQDDEVEIELKGKKIIINTDLTNEGKE